jgi:hypothetical protein
VTMTRLVRIARIARLAWIAPAAWVAAATGCNGVLGIQETQLGATDAGATTDAAFVCTDLSDAADDGSGQFTLDAGPTGPCQEYCTCMDTFCESTPPAGPDCLSVCMGLNCTALACRIYHCHNAQNISPIIHCPHAAGQAVCQ